MSKTAILLSGGIDSIALTYWKKPDVAITVNYGQAPAETEIRTSATIAKALNIPHYIVTADCSKLGSGDLLNQAALSVSPSSEWWPYRNQLLVTLACMKGIALGIGELMLASVKSDGFHKDGTAQFYKLMSQLSAGALDVAICPMNPAAVAEGFQFVPVLPGRNVIACGSHHPLLR
ncbi:MAG: 7-cyano-7-deazaguanine synthase, partial [Sphingobacteriaceae bacterium]